METFTSKVIDLTQPKLQTIWNAKKREEMDKIIVCLFFVLDVGFLLMSSNQIISNKWYLMLDITVFGIYLQVMKSWEQYCWKKWKMIWSKIWMLWRKVGKKLDVP